jgi:endonuclease/exonuclease/phosphatase family metal-dependent hydrolase
MLSILTFNTAIQDIRILGQSVYRPVKYIKERLEELSKQLTKLSPDIICLQELFHPSLQQQLYGMLKSDYPYFNGFAKTGFELRLGNELLIFSKFPLQEGKLFRFSNAAIEERLFTNKGFHITFLDSPMGEMQLVNMHMTAGGLRDHPEDQHMEKIRSNQIQQLIKTISNGMPTLLVGDLNAGPETSQKNYHAVLDAGFTDVFQVQPGIQAIHSLHQVMKMIYLYNVSIIFF